MDLNDVLSDKPIPAREPEKVESATDDKPAVETKVETPEPAAPSAAKEKPEAEPETAEQKAARERDDKGRFTKTVPHEALHAERTKRQELERKLQELTSQPPPKPTSVLEDEDKAFSERLTKATQPLMERFFKLSVKTARQGREDYEAVAGAFQEAAASDPRLWEQFRASDDPGEYVYTVGKQIQELGDVGGDILKYGEKKRSEGLAQAEALKAQIKALEAEIASLKQSKERQDRIPQSLNGEQSATARSGEWSGPTSLKSIIS